MIVSLADSQTSEIHRMGSKQRKFRKTTKSTSGFTVWMHRLGHFNSEF